MKSVFHYNLHNPIIAIKGLCNERSETGLGNIKVETTIQLTQKCHFQNPICKMFLVAL